MELRDFAEQVLFATNLREKLHAPDHLTDERPGPALPAPAAPGRPPGLEFKAAGEGSGFPALRQLDRAPERGRLLHFFANHELLAAELMALVLLRFPEAPAAFRRGVAQTLQDEQEHTRLYLDRMQASGVEFGEAPVSGYFWRALATMENPVDYVAGLSLTFEQANLDFARHFASAFAAVGDARTAALLERIHHDEIAHVAYGLKWFRRWKNPAESDWEAFRRQLKFPLSPRRAKGFSLNVEARRAAGLDPAFIAELNVFSASKGRTPGVFVFNPFSEGFIAQGRAFTPVKAQAALAADLACLPQFLSREDDIVLAPKRPSVQFLSRLKDAGFPPPEFVELRQGRLTPDMAVTRRKLGRLRPWAWGPDSVQLLAPLFPNVAGAPRPAGECFNPGVAALYSKAWSAAFLSKVLARLAVLWPEADWLCPLAEVGAPASSIEEVADVVARIRARGHRRIVVKECFGLAGANALRLWEPEVSEAQRRWMANAFAAGRSLVVEPWLERVADFSVQAERDAHGLRLRGYTGLEVDARGQFQANWAEPDFTRRLPGVVARALAGHGTAARRLPTLYPEILRLLEAELQPLGFRGPVGIDAFVYRTPEGGCRLKPVVEINPRHTMGRLTLELMNRACPGTTGRFRILGLAQLKAESPGVADFPSYARRLQDSRPLELHGEPVPRIRRGSLCLNDPETAQAWLALFEVASPESPTPAPPSAEMGMSEPRAKRHSWGG